MVPVFRIALLRRDATDASDAGRDHAGRERNDRDGGGESLFPAGVHRPDAVRGEWDAHDLPVEGVASYYHVWADNGLVRDAAWYYPVPKPEAAKIASHVAFYANKVRIGE